jgi:RNA polymerase sigma-70 factor (ECF subfamily)
VAEELGAVEAVESFESFFAATSPGLVGQAYVLTGNLQEAQDLVQEAMLRAWREWPKISNYEDPVGWVRKVVHNLAVSRWRRLAVRRRHEAAERVVDSPAPDVGHLDLVAVVAKLPAGQRRALVLFDVVGLSGEEVAAELGVPAGTVRGWLTRARRTVAEQLGWDDTPPLQLLIDGEEGTPHV